MSLFASSRIAHRAVSLPPELVIACLHTSASSSLQASSSLSAQRSAPSRTRLVKNLKSSSKGKVEVAPPPPPPPRDEAPHIGRKPYIESAPRKRPTTRELEQRRLQRLEYKGGSKQFKKFPASLSVSSARFTKETPGRFNKETSSRFSRETPARFNEDTPARFNRDTPARFNRDTPARFNRDTPARFNWDTPARFNEDTPARFNKEAPARYNETPARFTRETAERVIKETHAPPAKISNPLGDEFDITNRAVSTQELPQEFTSPPLMEGLLTSVREALGPDACPTPIQALSLKHLVQMERSDPEKYHEYLLASETGSGKSMAYLLPMIQDLKQSELNGTQRRAPDSSAQRRAMNPRALVLAPTHELSRQLAGFAKELIHNTKLRVLCASRANTSSRKNVSAAKMADALFDEELSGEMFARPGAQAHGVDIVVGTPSKMLELMRGRGWDYDPEEQPHRKVVIGQPQMGLADVEWVVVDEADVLFDPDFQEQTRLILSEVAAARGHPVPYEPTLDLSTDEPATPLNYPFNFILTSATIPSALAAYLDRFHPSLTRLASPNLHKLPPKLKTEFVSWTGGNRDADIEHQLRRVWATDAEKGRPKSKVLVFCNKGTRVEALGEALREKGIPNVALTKGGDARLRGSNHHLDGFLRVRNAAASEPLAAPQAEEEAESEKKDKEKKEKEKEKAQETPSVMITTSLLSRGLDFAPDVQHVFIVDEPRNMVDFLHRAGRSGRAGQDGKVVVFVKDKGRGSDKAREVQEKVGALQRGRGARRKN
ncbi:P-loop containing nucleoside triphosphate hydrolase protein [Lentinus tigrinus ALCF2SS1-7]|uniref:RNA helicase n=1 Tax=Lentinus tigrinus ALCF2SS1-6 TaxID=1328759 RepID=A0A5C2RYX0_9APHY|nr:P-loop containing nucleoside triphosphate hydrolase protein [Lentinus tigrinus ALCF2SS1-6]RPD71064.1 P-loop containing nucleoside triphosphate hydrolase protein [Lentinus tigrinus ALCF2SS1-7]